MSPSLLACPFCQSVIVSSLRLIIPLLNRRDSSVSSTYLGFALKAAAFSCSFSYLENLTIDSSSVSSVCIPMHVNSEFPVSEINRQGSYIEVIIWSFFKWWLWYVAH
jgi:hypothetical protein